MKKYLYFLVIPLMLVGFLTVNCTKDPVDPPVDLPKYTVVVSANDTNGTVFPIGDTLVEKWKNLVLNMRPKEGFKAWVVNVNDKDYFLDDNNKTFTLYNVLEDTKVSVSFKKDWSYYLMKGPWKLDSTLIRKKGEDWKRYPLWGVPGETQQEISFLSTGRVRAVWDGEYVGDPLWTLDDNIDPPILHIGMTIDAPQGTVYEIDRLDESSLNITTYDVPFIEDPSLTADIGFIYTHY